MKSYLMGGIKVGYWYAQLGGNFLGFVFYQHFLDLFNLSWRFYPTASVGSRNALHVVGAG
jgi:hypothetical protein